MQKRGVSTPFLVATAVILAPLSLLILAGKLRRGSKSWAALVKAYGKAVDLSGCHSQDGIQIGSGKVITEGPTKVGATPDGLVIKPHGMKTVLLPWKNLYIEDHQGEWFAHLRLTTGEVPSLGIRRNIYDSILKALEDHPALDHLRKPS